MGSSRPLRGFHRIGGWAAATLFLVGVMCINPRAEIGVNDDWSYMYTTKVLAQTGHLSFNGWATAMLGWQVYLGALFVRVFGYSCTAMRASTVLLTVMMLLLFHSLLRRFGVRPWNAFVGTVLIATSPLCFSLGTSYMTDIPGLLCLLLCAYGCKRALDAEDTAHTLLWLVFVAATNVAGGTVRQIAWLGALVIMPCTIWQLRRRNGALAVGAALWLISGISIALLIHWYNGQPYVISERLITLPLNSAGARSLAKSLLKSALTLDLLLSPLAFAFALMFPWGGASPTGKSCLVLSAC